MNSTLIVCWGLVLKVHWWKYVMENMVLATHNTEELVAGRVDDLVGLYVIPNEHKLQLV